MESSGPRTRGTFLSQAGRRANTRSRCTTWLSTRPMPDRGAVASPWMTAAPLRRRRPLVLRRSEGQDRIEDDAKEPEPDPEADILSERLGHVDRDQRRDHNVDERD